MATPDDPRSTPKGSLDDTKEFEPLELQPKVEFVDDDELPPQTIITERRVKNLFGGSKREPPPRWRLPERKPEN